MNSGQLAFDFNAPDAAKLAAEAAIAADDVVARGLDRLRKPIESARSYWRPGMVTSLPCFATIEDSDQRFTQMLPGVVESIDGEKATVRIYAAPEYGYSIDNYPLHRKLAINLSLYELCAHHRLHDLERIVAEGRLAHGDPELGAAVRARFCQREVA